MTRLLEISNHTLFWYYLASNLAYLTMLIVALKTSAAHQRSLKSHRLSWFKESPLAPPITIIAALNGPSLRASWGCLRFIFRKNQFQDHLKVRKGACPPLS